MTDEERAEAIDGLMLDIARIWFDNGGTIDNPYQSMNSPFVQSAERAFLRIADLRNLLSRT